MSVNNTTPAASTVRQLITTIGETSATPLGNHLGNVQKRWTKSAELAKLAAKSVITEKKMSEADPGVTVGQLGDGPSNVKNIVAVEESQALSNSKKQTGGTNEKSSANVARDANISVVSSLTQKLQQKFDSSDGSNPFIRPKKKPSICRPSSSVTTSQIQKTKENFERRSLLGTWSSNLGKLSFLLHSGVDYYWMLEVVAFF